MADNPIPSDSSSSDEDIQNDRVQYVSLAHRRRDAVHRLPGFNKKRHHVPDDINSHTQAFVAKLATDQVREDLDRVFAELRSSFRFKRSEIQSADWDEGSGVITTPYFRYNSAVVQDPDSADESIWLRDVSEITDVGRVLSDEFAAVFGSQFDMVEFNPPEPIDLGAIVDHVEAIDDDRIWIEYDRHLTRCEVTLDGHAEKIQITGESFRIVHPQTESPRCLIDSFFRVQNRLLGSDSRH